MPDHLFNHLIFTPKISKWLVYIETDSDSAAWHGTIHVRPSIWLSVKPLDILAIIQPISIACAVREPQIVGRRELCACHIVHHFCLDSCQFNVAFDQHMDTHTALRHRWLYSIQIDAATFWTNLIHVHLISSTSKQIIRHYGANRYFSQLFPNRTRKLDSNRMHGIFGIHIHDICNTHRYIRYVQGVVVATSSFFHSW